MEMKMANRKRAGDSGEMNGTVTAAEKRVILSMGGKGGVGKTSVMAGLAPRVPARRPRFRNCIAV